MIKKAASRTLEIKKSSGKLSIYKTAWCVIGPPGVGKSTLFSGFDGVLYLVTSEKELTRLNVPYLLINDWDTVLDVTNELLENRSKYGEYRFLVIDFIDAVWTMCVIATCKKLGVDHTSDAGYGKGVDMVDQAFKKWVTRLVSSDYATMFISHVQQKDVIQAGGTVTKTVCTLPQRARMILFPLINVIGCMEYRTVKTQLPSGKMDFVKKRVITFEATEYVEAKDRDGVLPNEIVLSKDPKKNFEAFRSYYERG